MTDTEVPENVRLAFVNRTLMSAPDVAALLGLSAKTLRAHIANGDLPGRIKGTGVTRRHWVFTIADVSEFLKSRQPPSKITGIIRQGSPPGREVKMNMRLRVRKRALDKGEG